MDHCVLSRKVSHMASTYSSNAKGTEIADPLSVHAHHHLLQFVLNWLVAGAEPSDWFRICGRAARLARQHTITHLRDVTSGELGDFLVTGSIAR